MGIFGRPAVTPGRSVKRRLLSRFTAFVSAVGMLSGLLPAGTIVVTPVVAASTTTIHLRVESARAWAPSGLAEGQLIPGYHWLIVKDDTGNPTHYGTNLGMVHGNSNYDCVPAARGGDPDYPANCDWPSIHSAPGGTSAEVLAQGDQSNLNLATGLTLPNGKYMITVTADPFDIAGCTSSATVTCHADGFKVDGQWFSIPSAAVNGLVTVSMQPYPLPLLTVRMAVWNDLQTNGSYDTGEPNLAGFEGHIADVLGAVTTDWYGNPICTVYAHDADSLMIFGETLDTGSAVRSNSTTLTDASQAWTVNQWVGQQVYIAGGSQAGQVRAITANTATALTIDPSISNFGGSQPYVIFGEGDAPLVQTLGGHCLSDNDGVVSIPYLGPDRYSATVVPPAGEEWYQTSTLEGWHDWDTWSIEGWDGYDPEFVQGREPFPFAEFGFVQRHGNQTTHKPTSTTSSATGSIKGTIVATSEFAPLLGGYTLGGGQGKRIIGPVEQPLVSLIDTNNDDQTVYVGRGATDGTFQINGVPDGDYVLAWWDEDQAYILTQANVEVRNGQALDLGVLDTAAWWSRVHGRVCSDTNRNGKCDAGEPGLAGLSLNLLGRDNTVQFYGDNTATTDTHGNYDFPRAYPLGQWVVAQGYWEQFYTVGVTYQTNNQPTATTVMANGGFVDVSTFNLIGMDTRMDWAIHTYETDPALGPTNGGIVGEVAATSTRNELDARFQALEPYEPGLPGATVHLYTPIRCASGQPTPAGTSCTLATTAFGSNYYLTSSTDGSFVKLSTNASDPLAGTPIDLVDPYLTETWQRPTDCIPRDADGNQVVEQVLPPSTGGHDCLEAPLMSSQVGDNSVGDFMQVDGNYGFTAIDHDPITGAALADPIELPQGDYLVEAVSPTGLDGKPTYEPVKDEDVNIFSGDSYVAPGETPLNPPTPQSSPNPTPVPAIPPFPCAGPLHVVDVVADRADANYDPANPSTTQGVYNPDFVDGGGSPYQAQPRPLCSTQLVTVRRGRSATPTFHMKTQEVPLPGRVFGLVVDDLNLSSNPTELFYGEKKGIPNIPIGIYDFSNRLVTTIQTDPNGSFEVILPSTSTYNCPLPAGPCPGIYRFYGNDPGQPGHPNLNFNPAYRSIGAFFEVWPGVSLPADLAPSPVSFGIENPGTQTAAPAQCLLNDPSISADPSVPELFAIDRPYASSTGGTRTFTVRGQGFGASRGSGSLTLDGSPMSISTWNDGQITFTLPSGFVPGAHQLVITGDNGRHTVNGLTFHVTGSGYNPTIYEVGPGKTYNPTTDPHAIQHAIDAASGTGSRLVVVYPGPTGSFNPLGSYYENLIIHSPLKLQGVGPGGTRADGSQVLGTVIDSLGYGTDGDREAAWAATLTAIPNILGPNNQLADPDTLPVPEGEVILSVATSTNQYASSNGSRPAWTAAIDGLLVQNGDVMDFVPNVNSLGNGSQVGGGNNTPANQNQGGGIVAFANAKYLSITNNVIRSNAGAYAGAIRVGTPTVGDNNNDDLRILNNRILNNGGSNLAGAVGLFAGAAGYQVAGNDICGNFSAEYGGGISHFGLSGRVQADGRRTTSSTGIVPSIHDNRIYFNGSYDEGAGIIVAGEPATTIGTLSAGAGAVDITSNLIEANLANDDGGGLRFLQAGNFPYNVSNNIIVDNISTHEGGGVALDDAPNVRFFNNTVMKNVTTATAASSNGQPKPAGLSTGLNSDQLQTTLPGGVANCGIGTNAPCYSRPVLFNNIFWNNWAGTWDPTYGIVRGIGASDQAGNLDPTPLNPWDMGVSGGVGTLLPTNSILEPTSNAGVTPDASNILLNPKVVDDSYSVTIASLPWRGNPNFVANVTVAQDLPVTILGDFHLADSSSPAFNLGAASKALPTYQQPPATLAAPTRDIDGDVRPAQGGFDAGADEIPAPPADLSITKTDGATSVAAGGSVNYTIVAANAGPTTAIQAIVTDAFPAAISGVTWTCTGAGGGTCPASGSGNLSAAVDLPSGGSVTFVAGGTLTSSPTGGSVTNTATVAAPVTITDTNPANNSASDTDTLTVVSPISGKLLDDFNRPDASNLGANWAQPNTNLRIRSQQADAGSTGVAYWTAAVFGTDQAAGFTFSNTTLNADRLVLKATGATASNPASYLRIAYATTGGGQVTVQTTTNGNTGSPTFTTRATFTGVAFVNGDTLAARAKADGTVTVYRTAGGVTTVVGVVLIPTSGAGSWAGGSGGGRIGIQLTSGSRIDNFSGGNLP